MSTNITTIVISDYRSQDLTIITKLNEFSFVNNIILIRKDEDIIIDNDCINIFYTYCTISHKSKHYL